MDVLSDLITTLRFSSSAFLDARFTAPWSMEAQITPEDCSPFGPLPKDIVAYHYVVSGNLYLTLPNARSSKIKSGDIVLLPHNDRHVLASATGLSPARIDHLIQPGSASCPAQLQIGGGGEPCHIICGFFGCDLPNNPLLDSLPASLTFSTGETQFDEWIGNCFQHAAEEFANGGIGSASILGKLAELLFVEALRKYLLTLPTDQHGWLAGLRDPKIGKALASMHQQPSHTWTIDELAGITDLSRSAFADRFTQIVGVPPVRYLTQWRLQLAAIRLRGSPQSIGRIAYDVGYESEAAFNRAFRKAFLCTPGQWRHS